ncbi:unnamed protein product [Rotaria socialis]|nr:unnamed protein product [Rotaria socialis]CAF4443633.1 unnamed protein product [Rotaria socialis]CAF4501489.1 unnamed protein product [Rotaria socialis]CAF4666806.1 unnamed protein product [Rotaria socialis]
MGEVSSRLGCFQQQFAQEPVPIVSSRTQRALSNGMLRFLIAETIKNLSTPLDKAHQVLLGTGLEQLEQVPGQIAAENT